MATRTSLPFPLASWWFVALLAAAVFAFWPLYVSKVTQVGDVYVHLHTAGVVVWMALLISQPLLVKRGRWRLHRRLGSLAWPLIPYIAVTSILLAHSRFRAMDAVTFARDGHSVYLPLVAVLLFMLCAGLALRYRRDMPVHARFMIATALPLIDPIMARFLFFYTPVPAGPIVYPLIGYGFTEFVLALLIWLERDATRGRWVFPRLLGVFVTAHIGWFTLANTQAWLSLSTWFRDLPLT